MNDEEIRIMIAVVTVVGAVSGRFPPLPEFPGRDEPHIEVEQHQPRDIRRFQFLTALETVQAARFIKGEVRLTRG